MKHIISLLIVLTVSFSVSFASAREWTAASGHKITGDFVKCENGTVEIKLADTKTAEVKLEQLSDADREFVRQEIEKAKKAEVPNPFVVKDKPAAQPPAPVEGNIENITADTAYRKGIEARNAGNIEEAKKWLRKAAELGDAFADGQLKRLDAADTSDNDYPLPYGIDGKYGYVSRDCVEVIPRQYDSAEPFSEGLALVKRNGKWGFIDKSGKEITELKYDDVGDFSEELTNVKRDGKYGFIDKTGKEIIEPKYEFAWGFSEGLAAVKKDGKGGFIDKTGKEVIEYKYDDAGEFREGLATVRKDGKWGFIDKTDKEVIEPKYESAWGFSEGLALV
ncbi:MAG: WG repeat-containing protein, partial [Planctomycetaceae bacterium]|nr:WG repeat-containing protein [Planctomycetaceae bacterium]